MEPGRKADSTPGLPVAATRPASRAFRGLGLPSARGPDLRSPLGGRETGRQSRHPPPSAPSRPAPCTLRPAPQTHPFHVFWLLSPGFMFLRWIYVGLHKRKLYWSSWPAYERNRHARRPGRIQLSPDDLRSLLNVENSGCPLEDTSKENSRGPTNNLVTSQEDAYDSGDFFATGKSAC